MAIFDFLRSLATKKQTSPEKWLDSSVRIVTAGQQGAQKPPFSHERAVNLFRSWIYAAATINANAVASTPIRLYAKKGAGRKLFRTRSVSKVRKSYMLGDGPGDQRPSMSVLRKVADFGDDYEEVTEMHPIIELLSSCNPFLNGFDSTVLRVLYGELTGNAYLHPVIDEETGMPAELWPLAPQFTEVIPDEDEFIRGFLYGVDSSKKQVFQRDEVIHFRRPNPGNLYYGLGKIEAAYGAVLSNQAIHDMDLATFQNSARPDYAVVVRGTPTSDQLDRFQEQVEQRLRGTRKDGNFIAVTGDVQFTPLNFPPKDIIGREDIVEEIAAVFGVPVTMLKSNDPNLASSKTGFAQWREGTILPLVRMDEEELNQSLLPMFGLEDELILCYDNPVPADKAFELQERQAAVSGGWRTPNEARLEEGKDPIEDNEFADQLLINGQPIGGMAAQQQQMGGGGGFPFMDQVFSGGESGGSQTPAPEADATEGPDIEFASKILGAVRGRSLARYSAIKLIQGAGFSRSVAEKMIDAEEENAPETKVERREGESLDACVARGIETLMAEGYEREQATAIAFKQCGQKAMNLDDPEEKCPGDDCDDCGHSGTPRPKAFRLRPTLDGASTEAIVKSWDRWGLLVKESKENCGTGAGGFKEDNTCATGSAAKEKPKSESKSRLTQWNGTNPMTPEDREFFERIARTNEDGTNEFQQMSRKEKDAVYDRLVQLDEAGFMEAVSFIHPRFMDGFEVGRWNQQKSLLDLVQGKGMLGFRPYLDDFADDPRSMGFIRSKVMDALERNGLVEFSDGLAGIAEKDAMKAAIAIAMGQTTSNAVQQVQADIKQYGRVLSAGTQPDIEGKIQILAGSRDAAFDIADANIEEYWEELNPTAQAIAVTADRLAAERLPSVVNVGEDGTMQGFVGTPQEALDAAMDEANAWSKHFLERGAIVRVDPGIFLPRQPGPQVNGNTTFDWQENYGSEARRDIAQAYRELLSVDEALTRIEDAGIDPGRPMIRMIRMEDYNTTPYLWTRPEDIDIRASGWWHNAESAMTLPVDRALDSKLDLGDHIFKNGWLVAADHDQYGTMIHEMGHALHSQNIKADRKTYLRQESYRHAEKWLADNGWSSTEEPAKAWKASIDLALLNSDHNRGKSGGMSRYGATEATEYVAEAFTMKVLDPARWEGIKDRPILDADYDIPELEKNNGVTREMLDRLTFSALYDIFGGA